MAHFDFVLQYPITVTADSLEEAQDRATDWLLSIRDALYRAQNELIEKGGVLIAGPGSVVPQAKPDSAA
jgi:hypothetical protein